MTTVFHLKQLHRGIAETIVSRESLGKSRDSLCVRHTRLKALGESNGGLINRIESIETNKWHGRVPVNSDAARNIIIFLFRQIAYREISYTTHHRDFLYYVYAMYIWSYKAHDIRIGGRPFQLFYISLQHGELQSIFTMLKNVADMLLHNKFERFEYSNKDEISQN